MKCPNCGSNRYVEKEDPMYGYPLYQCGSCVYTVMKTSEDYDNLMAKIRENKKLMQERVV